MPEQETPQPATPTAEAPAPTPQPTQEPIVEAKKPAINSMWLIAGVLLILVAAVAAYAYSQGYFSSVLPGAASPQTSTTPTISDDITAVNNTATEVNSDLNDINSAMNSLDSLDTSNDQAPSL